MFREIQEETLSFLYIYANILNSCTNKRAKVFLIKRIFKILSKSFKERKPSDFPKVSFDLQVVNLVSYIKEGKLPYAFLFASSLNAIVAQNTIKYTDKTIGHPVGIWERFKAYIGF